MLDSASSRCAVLLDLRLAIEPSRRPTRFRGRCQLGSGEIDGYPARGDVLVPEHVARDLPRGVQMLRMDVAPILHGAIGNDDPLGPRRSGQHPSRQSKRIECTAPRPKGPRGASVPAGGNRTGRRRCFDVLSTMAQEVPEPRQAFRDPVSIVLEVIRPQEDEALGDRPRVAPNELRRQQRRAPQDDTLWAIPPPSAKERLSNQSAVGVIDEIEVGHQPSWQEIAVFHDFVSQEAHTRWKEWVGENERPLMSRRSGP